MSAMVDAKAYYSDSAKWALQAMSSVQDIQKQPPKQTCFELEETDDDDDNDYDYYDYWNDGYWQYDEVAGVAEVADAQGKV